MGATGMEVNGQLLQEGSQRRLERVFIKTPRNVEIGIYSNSVTLGYDGHASRRFSFEEDTEIGIADAHIAIISHGSARKVGALVTLRGDLFDTQFHISVKNRKNSLKFEIIDSRGLRNAPLDGIIGHSILPNDYSIDNEGFVIVGKQKLQSRAEWKEHEMCHLISGEAVRAFLGHNVEHYRVRDKFSRFPSGGLVEDISPK